MNDVADRLIAWHARAGRHDLPWQRDWIALADPYRVWLSEIMLQQTQVATVIPYYERFVERFPTLAALAAAPVEEIMSLWSGLGYYARARNLHACARTIVASHGGRLPRDAEAIAALPGIGRSTANAIAVFCFGARAPILDGNVKRVLCRVFGIVGYPGAAAVERQLWALAQELLPPTGADTYIQAQMDLGATICVRGTPRCDACPMADICVAHRDSRTAELPQAKPRRALPERETTVLVLMHKERVLLETRPTVGIWGGMMSLPELPVGVPPENHALALGCRVVAIDEWPPLTHTFTHFRLTLRPLRLAVEPLGGVEENGRRWLGRKDLAAAALPAPIRKLLSASL